MISAWSLAHVSHICMQSGNRQTCGSTLASTVGLANHQPISAPESAMAQCDTAIPCSILKTGPTALHAFIQEPVQQEV